MIGQSFIPSFDEEERKRRQLQQGQNGDPNSQIQEAIKVLSLRIPRFQGGSQIAPMALMQGQGMPGGVNPIVEQVMRQFGVAAPGGVVQGPGGQTYGGGSAPAPRTIPGAGAPTKPPVPNIDFQDSLPPRPEEPALPGSRMPFGGRGRF